jgi:F-type H+-transporting ATPase subunit delta
MTDDGQDELNESFDVGSQRVARVYAEALLNAAEKHKQAEAVLAELEGVVHEVFGAAPHFEQFLSSGAVGRDRKQPVIHKAFGGRASEVFTNFLMVLNQHDRLDLLRPIQTAARELYDQRHRRIRVQVRTASALPDDKRQRLQQQLRQSFDMEPVLRVQVDPEILGGMVVRVGDWLYDASVRTQLETIRNQLIERSSHEIQSRRDRFRTTDGN